MPFLKFDMVNKMNVHQIKMITEDNYCLIGQFYPALKQSNHYPILICSATGIKQTFYRSFATWLSEQGYDVLTFDFRGIGQSLHQDLKYSTASIDDWGCLDIPTAILTLKEQTNADKVILIGHSAGGQLLGVVPNYNDVIKMITFASSTGYTKQLAGKTKLLAPVMFDVIFPISSLIKGYGATKMIGMGENLPKNVARQWREFCHSGFYVKYSIGKTIMNDYHDKVSCDIHAFYADDDEIATQKNVKDLFSLFGGAKIYYHPLSVKQYQLKEIGHMGLFKKSHQVLWKEILKVL